MAPKVKYRFKELERKNISRLENKLWSSPPSNNAHFGGQVLRFSNKLWYIYIFFYICCILKKTSFLLTEKFKKTNKKGHESLYAIVCRLQNAKFDPSCAFQNTFLSGFLCKMSPAEKTPVNGHLRISGIFNFTKIILKGALINTTQKSQNAHSVHICLLASKRSYPSISRISLVQLSSLAS